MISYARSIAGQQFFRFLLAGGLAAAVNFGTRIVLSLWLDYALAITLAYAVGICTAFLLNRRFVFQQSLNSTRTQFTWFVVINIVAFVQTILVSLGLARYLFPAIGLVHGAETIAHAIGIATPVLTSYLGHRKFSFRH